MLKAVSGQKLKTVIMMRNSVFLLREAHIGAILKFEHLTKQLLSFHPKSHGKLPSSALIFLKFKSNIVRHIFTLIALNIFKYPLGSF